MFVTATPTRSHVIPAARVRGGYSFAEVLFAVAVLGIGFIMVAAIFPVAIQQTQAAMDETIGTTATRNGAEYLRGTKYFSPTTMPATISPQAAPAAPAPANPLAVMSFHDPRLPAGPPTSDQLWNSVKGSLIMPGDARFAVVPLFSHSQSSGFAKLIVFGVRIRNRDGFKATGTPNDVDRVGQTCAELEPKPAIVETEDRTDGADRLWVRNITKSDGTNTNLAQLSGASNAMGAACPGAYVVISDDRVADDTTPAKLATNEYGLRNGKIYQLGPEITPSSKSGFRQFELVPGEDLASAAENLPGATSGSKSAIAFVIGAGYAGVGSAGNYSGTAQPVQKYVTIVPLESQ